MKIKDISVGSEFPPIIIPEISGNHNQSIENIYKLIDAIKKAGLKFVKLQTYTPDTITLNSSSKDFLVSEKHQLWGGEKLYNLYQKAHTPWNWHKEIFAKCANLGLICFSSPFDETAVKLLEDLKTPLYKVASFEITHIPLLAEIGKTRKPVILSTGMATEKEIYEAINTLLKNGCNKYALLKCTSTYPADPFDSNIATLSDMKKKYNCEVGISDHTPGIGVSIAAVSFGASIIEKHITLDRDNGAVDSFFSLEPYEFKILNIESKRAWQSIGKVKYGPTTNEKESLKHRRSIYVTEDLKKGDVINIENIKIIRPSAGLEPKYFEKIIGIRLIKDIKKNSPLDFSYIEISKDDID